MSYDDNISNPSSMVPASNFDGSRAVRAVEF